MLNRRARGRRGVCSSAKNANRSVAVVQAGQETRHRLNPPATCSGISRIVSFQSSLPRWLPIVTGRTEYPGERLTLHAIPGFRVLAGTIFLDDISPRSATTEVFHREPSIAMIDTRVRVLFFVCVCASVSVFEHVDLWMFDWSLMGDWKLR